MRNPSEISIAYPGITAEICDKNAYEVVWNCGGLAALFLILMKTQNETHKNTVVKYIRDLLSHYKDRHGKIIFLTDKEITENPITHQVFEDIFGTGNFCCIATQRNEYHDAHAITGARIVRSSFFTREEDIVRILTENPDTPVISSIPYSDPRIDNIMKKYKEIGSPRSLSWETFFLLLLNARRGNQTEVIDPESLGFLGTAHSTQELETIFQANPHIGLVIKPDEGSAGGTAHSFLFTADHRKDLLAQPENIPFPVLVFRYFHPVTLTEKATRKSYPVHIRPFFDINEEFIGLALKIAEKPQSDNVGKQGKLSKQRSLQLSSENNTSSGKSKTLFFDKDGQAVAGMMGIGEEPIFQEEIHNFLSGYTYNGQAITPDLLVTIAKGSQALIADIHRRTNNLLSGQKWSMDIQ